MTDPLIGDSEIGRALETLNLNEGGSPDGLFLNVRKTLTLCITRMFNFPLLSPQVPDISCKKLPVQLTRTCSGQSVLPLLFTQHLNLSSKSMG